MQPVYKLYEHDFPVAFLKSEWRNKSRVIKIEGMIFAGGRLVRYQLSEPGKDLYEQPAELINSLVQKGDLVRVEYRSSVIQ